MSKNCKHLRNSLSLEAKNRAKPAAEKLYESHGENLVLRDEGDQKRYEERHKDAFIKSFLESYVEAACRVHTGCFKQLIKLGYSDELIESVTKLSASDIAALRAEKQV